MEKQKRSALDPVFDAMKMTGRLMRGQGPKPEELVSPGMKRLAKGIGDVAVFGWSKTKK
jgi:hypothetical protein